MTGIGELVFSLLLRFVYSWSFVEVLALMGATKGCFDFSIKQGPYALLLLRSGGFYLPARGCRRAPSNGGAAAARGR